MTRKTYDRDAVEAIRGAIVAMPPKERSTRLSLRQVAKELSDELHQAVDDGYTMLELAKALTDHGIAIKPGTLRAYLPPRSDKSTPKSTRKNRLNARRKESRTPSDKKAERPATSSRSGTFEPRTDRESV